MSNIKQIFNKIFQQDQNFNSMYNKIGYQYAGPILFNYVWWVLYTAKKDNIKTLYFIARDGYPLYNIANIIINKFSLGIKCKYLYCSRKSLILPSLINNYEDELYNLTKYSTKCSLSILLDRINASEQDKTEIYLDVTNNLFNIDMNEQLSIDNHRKLQNYLLNSNIYIEILKNNAKTNYDYTIGYLKQEGLFDENKVYIVDLGWAGSIQKFLNKIVKTVNPNLDIFAFYFGTLNSKYLNDNNTIYKSWYFSKGNNIKHNVFFSINLMEMISTAPHGSAISYEKLNDIYEAKLGLINEENKKVIENINSGIISFAKYILLYIKFEEFKIKPLQDITYSICYKLMVKPTAQIVQAFSNIKHCDDISNNYSINLIEEDDIKYLKNYQIHIKVLNKLLKKNYTEYRELVWPFGVIIQQSLLKRLWYRINIAITYYIRYKKEI